MRIQRRLDAHINDRPEMGLMIFLGEALRGVMPAIRLSVTMAVDDVLNNERD